MKWILTILNCKIETEGFYLLIRVLLASIAISPVPTPKHGSELLGSWQLIKNWNFHTANKIDVYVKKKKRNWCDIQDRTWKWICQTIISACFQVTKNVHKNWLKAYARSKKGIRWERLYIVIVMSIKYEVWTRNCLFPSPTRKK